MLRVVGVSDLDGLAACLQREADRTGRAMLLIPGGCPKREYTSGPYGVFEDCADEWERRNHERRLVPAGVRDDVGDQAADRVDA